MTNKIPFSDYREIISLMNTEGTDSDRYYALFENEGWGDNYFWVWRKNTFGVSPHMIFTEKGFRFFVKTVLNKYKNTEL